MKKGSLRPAPGRKLSLTLDEATNRQLLNARERSGRTKTNEALVRLQDHLSRYPDFYNEEIFREVTEETESTFKEI
ncbi:TPA: conjugal transfer relaxosome protein TraY [Salmonella enterica subsp. enterica serovar Birkenhead]|uniref:conjugal transfer relaxosome protein TraY n=1 Tax=Salmonella enterica TaxID=28901 RepID=UPI0012AA9499|nr:conjugal transfer relaxosome protein TraY [Salmonella enterica]EBY7195169.1 conjugal transfer relaxosome protein TraY [Salmonella enterica subsp. enterica serovar Birkenhead]EDV0048180.1 conjugal transfer relaxosome protein TraY [Salmonella enterica subsp. enterica serovar Birkenhead]EHI3950916.1 conjugal transfer relaxosome protein TraY [Salmonella enterica]EHI6135289.1 conjugal transfer relaxosome protein TraY [Salmonella enterica]EHI7993450.1 conjugal transfer relaxosome protein TraY [Sa